MKRFTLPQNIPTVTTINVILNAKKLTENPKATNKLAKHEADRTPNTSTMIPDIIAEI